MPLRFTRQRVVYYCSVLLVSAIAIQAVSVIRDRQIGGDFAVFYAEGKVVNNNPHSQLYNLELHDKEYEKLWGTGTSSPFAYSPWFTIPVALIARLPYVMAFLLWTLLSLILLFVAVRLMVRAGTVPTDWTNLAFFVSLTFPPFLIYSLLNGHPSSFALFVLTLTYLLHMKKERFYSGIVLSLLSYKPTFLIFITPMLLFTRQWKAFLGLITGGSFLALIGIAWAGIDGTRSYFWLLKLYAQSINSHIDIFQGNKYIDLGSATRSLMGPQPWLRSILLVVALPLVSLLWYRLGPQPISWTIAIVCGLLLNMYTPIYDCTLLIFGITLIGVTNVNKWLLIALYFVSFLTVPMAALTGVQLYTIVLIWLLAVLVTRVFTVDGIEHQKMA